MKRHHSNISINCLTATNTYVTWQRTQCLHFPIKFQHMVYENILLGGGGKTEFSNKGHFVENKIQIIQHPFHKELNFFVAKYIK